MNKRDNIFEHVLYEFNMYLQTFYHWVMIEEEKGNVYKNNVNYESHQIHLRILMEFFEDESIKSDDIVVSTVVNSIEGLIINKDDFIEEKKSINKSISHITKTRCKKDYDENVTYIINMYTVVGVMVYYLFKNYQFGLI